jgi:hypothetical protein
MDLCNIKEQNFRRKNVRFVFIRNIFSSGADAIKKFTPSLGIPYLGV